MPARYAFTVAVLGLLFMVMLLTPEISRSVPSFARQTELACSNCHTVFPELTPFGRLFKLQGYTLSSEEAIEVKDSTEKVSLRLPKIPPFSAMAQTSYTQLKKSQPGTQNGNVSFPQQFSFFFAGEISNEVGGFVQVTWDDESSAFSMDLMDFRFSHHTTLADRALILGLTLNNTPTVQDVWNSTTAWGFPYISSNVAPTPTASPLVAGGLGSLGPSVAGLGGYSLYNNFLYTEFTLYRTTLSSTAHPPDSNATYTMKSVAPYWRVALQHQWTNLYFEVGTYGMYANFYPQGVVGPQDRYTDYGFDMQAMTELGEGNLTAHTTWVGEKRTLEATFGAGGSERPSENLNLFKIDANYYYKKRYGVALGYFQSSGDRDTLMYAPAPVTGSRTGNPNSSGLILELDYLPWLNTKIWAQYIAYNKFNGASSNYDGSGRDAADNNTLYLSLWLAM